MPIFKEYTDFDAVGIAELIKSKKIQPIDVLDTAIELIEKLDPTLNFMHQKTYHFAMESLNRNKELNGPFAGVPMLMKDMDSSLYSVPMMQGSNYLKNIPMKFNNSLSKKIYKLWCFNMW